VHIFTARPVKNDEEMRELNHLAFQTMTMSVYSGEDRQAPLNESAI
jgi:hypothetical protein